MHLPSNPRLDVRVSTLGLIPSGPAGTIATLKKMRELIRAGKVSPTVRALASSLVASLPEKNYTAEARTLFYFVRDNIRYLRDIQDVETLQTPEVTLSMRQGDCDDKNILLAALLQSIGHEVQLVAIGVNGSPFCHVYSETKIGNRWVPMEPTEKWDFGVFGFKNVTKLYRLEV